MKSYNQLTYDQRCQIFTLLQEGLSQTAIARRLNCHQSSISRELKRNTGQRGYRYKQADSMAKARRLEAIEPRKMKCYLIALIDEKLRQDWSPEQIAGWLRRQKDIKISHETIYLHVWADKRRGGTLYFHLRHKLKGYRSRASHTGSRGQIKNRVSIHERPAIVETRERIGDWEIDLIIGKGHSGAMVTLVERKTRFTTSAAINDKSAEAVTAATIKLLKPLQHLVLTITADNGKEFSFHEKIAQSLNADFYFADAYSSWQRGSNENTNGLLRQYWPKNTDFKNVNQGEVDEVLAKLNARPRKVLNFQSPGDIFNPSVLKTN